MNDSFIKRCFRVDRTQIAYLRFILEGYDGLIFLRTLNPREALVEFAYAPSCRSDAEALLSALAAECALQETSCPPAEEYPPV